MAKKETKVLIIEDSASQAAIIGSVVREAGYQPVVYSQLPSGILQILSKENPNIVLLDLRLVDESGKSVADGFQICREIKRSKHPIPVIVISAEAEDEACQWALMQGADAFLQKPFAVEDLQQIMSQVLDKQ